MLKRILSILTMSLSLGAILVAVQVAPASAGPARVHINHQTLNLRDTRFYNDVNNARAGHDGWCYRGQDHPDAYACTVDTTTDRRRLKIEFPDCPSTDDPRICFTVDLAGADPNHAGWHIRWRLSADPWHAGQMPRCEPDWARWNRAYHDSPWTGENVYRCGFWKYLYTGPA